MGNSGLTMSGPPPMAGDDGGWNFDETIRGTMKGIPIHLDLAGLTLGDGDDGEWEVPEGEDEEGEEDVPWESVRVRVEGVGIGGRSISVRFQFPYPLSSRGWRLIL